MSVVLMSIKPKYVRRILLGNKRIELRKRKPVFEEGQHGLIYSTKPDGFVCARFVVDRVLGYAPHDYWAIYWASMGIDRAAYDRYFKGVKIAWGIHMRDVQRVEATDLAFHPPQSYLFLREDNPQHAALWAAVSAC